ncbi:HTH-type transcriptional regulator AbgR [Budvicia aquatica]|uniref:HTH-type transcriptional regulator AbgR n=1 Tax=Budvicia aquatica TaxID=82979 RepID=A0A484ZIW3_9GAMM|nr:HTH-type transcriptional regulator AbgR [Budvicia aquatica]
MTIVELRQIYYVIEVAKWNSFTKAAEVINITQPSLSQQISKLEKKYNIKIFDRTTRFVVPTDLGERFIEDAKLLINAVEGFNNKVMTRQHQINGTFRIGVERVIGYLNLYSLISAFQEKFPDVVITIIEGDTKNLILDMVNGVIDAAIYTNQ